MSFNKSVNPGIQQLLQRLNKTTVKDALERGSLAFYVDNKQVGLIRPDFWTHFKNYPDVFHLVEERDQIKKDGSAQRCGVHLSGDLRGYKQRTDALNSVLEDLRSKGSIGALNGWRNENYSVAQCFTVEPVMEVERAASGLFGFLQYGVHINGYTFSEDGKMKMWIGRRSKTKQTFPDMFDNMCAGGLPAGMGVLECARKECQEEGSVSDDILDGLKPVGCISYLYEDERGLQPETQFVFDLELPADFMPVNADGEMGSFQLLSIEQVEKEILSENFKPNCGAICLDFLIRHGYMEYDSDPNILLYLENMHVPLQSIYK